MENEVVDKNDSIDDEFDFDDDFPSFDDNDDFDFDDDDNEEAGSFDFADGDDEDSKPSLDQTEESSLSDDTYQFEDVAEENEAASSMDKNPNIIEQLLERIKKEEPKKLIIYGGVGFFAIVMVVFFIVSALSPAAKPTKTAADTAKKPATSQETQTAMQTISPSALPGIDTPPSTDQSALTAPVSGTETPSFTQPPVTKVVQPASDKMQKMVKELSEQNAKLSEQIQSIQGELSEEAGQYNNLAQQIQSTDARVTNIESSIARVESQMSKVNNALQAIVAAATSEQPTYNPRMNRQQMASGARITYKAPATSSDNTGSYYIQAIIPGRAWIKNGDGQTITVTYGDSISGLGKVTKIDAENGVIDTASGVKIMYGINEG